MTTDSFVTFGDVLRQRAVESPNKTAFIFLEDGEHESDSITHQQLDVRAKRIALELLKLGLYQQRVLLLYPPGIDYIYGLYDCLYTGTIAVLYYPPDPSGPSRTLPRMLAIARDTGAVITLRTELVRNFSSTLYNGYPDLQNRVPLPTNRFKARVADTWQEPSLDSSVLALPQCTSGSTETPKDIDSYFSILG